MQIPIINGIYTDETSDFRIAYPRNLVPVPGQHGISKGYLRPAEGVIEFATSSPPGLDRGAINWNDECYRVSGTKLIKVSKAGAITEIGTIPGTDQSTLDYSFDYLAVSGNGNMYLWNGSTLQQITDPDLGVVVDFIWVDGYFMSTDGEFLIVSELNDPFTISTLKYGSSEADPDPVKAIVKLRNEPHALNRYTIEAFDNIGGSLFPFQRIDGAQIQRGTVGTYTCCVFLENIAFLGGGRQESIAVWLGSSGQSIKISTREIDLVLAEYTEEVLSVVIVEAKVDKGHQHLYIHLPDQTLVYDGAASKVLGESVWFKLTSTLEGLGQYKARNFVYCYDKWIIGDPADPAVGYLSTDIGSHWGVDVGWDFGTLIIYNEGQGGIFHELELVALSGRQALGVNSTIWTRYSFDGESWSQEKSIRTGTIGNRTKRLVWIGQGPMKHWRIQQFRGLSDSRLSIARLEARIEPLAD